MQVEPMKIRKAPIFNNETGRDAYVFSDDGGESWCATLGYLVGRKPRGAGVSPTLRDLTEDDAVKRATAWIAGSHLAAIRMGNCQGIADSSRGMEARA